MDIMSRHWRSKSKRTTLVGRLNSAKKLGIFTDVTFIVGEEGEAHTFKAHRLVLACGSSVFETMLYGEARRDDDEPIRITDVTAYGFKYLLKYLYDLNVVLPDIITGRDTFMAAVKFQVDHLKTIASKYFYNAVTRDTAFSTLELAVEHNMRGLREKCLRTMLPDMVRILESREFPLASLEVVEAVLSVIRHERAKVQLRALISISSWWKKNETDSDSILKRLLSYVNYSGITVTAFNEFFAKCPGIVNASDRTTFVKHMLAPDLYSLPEWCIPLSQERPLTRVVETSSEETSS